MLRVAWPFILLPASTALTTPVDLRAERCDELPVSREILIEECRAAVFHVGPWRGSRPLPIAPPRQVVSTRIDEPRSGREFWPDQ